MCSGHDEDGKSVKAVLSKSVTCDPPRPGEVWRICGRLEKHPIYGQQIIVRQAHAIAPAGPFLGRTLRLHSQFRGIGLGEKKIAALEEAFGLELAQKISSGDLLALTQVLSEKVATVLLERWKEMSGEMEAVTYLDSIGFDVRLARKVHRAYRSDTQELIEENPYRLLAFASWTKVDDIAQRMGVDPHDDRRLVAGVEAVFYQRLDNGHTAMTKADLYDKFYQLVPSKDLIAEKAIALASKEKAIVFNTLTGSFQAIGPASMEAFLESHFQQLLTTQGRQCSLFEEQLGVEAMGKFFRHFEARAGFALTSRQRQAISLAVQYPLSAITGGAGTGKTTILRAIHELQDSLVSQTFQVALSGRAAQKMREATGRSAWTFVAFTAGCQKRQIKFSNTPLILVDESSMVDVPTMCRFIRALPGPARFCFVGDAHQLPPVGFGSIFMEFLHSSSVPAIELDAVHRQVGGSNLLHFANSVRQGQWVEMDDYHGMSEGVSCFQCSPDHIISSIENIVSSLGGFGEDLQILSMTKRYGAGCVRLINDHFHRNNHWQGKALDGWGIKEGDPIVFTRNDYEREIFNGSLGRVLSIENSKSSYSLKCILDGKEIVLAHEDLYDIDLAYSLTVHKAQGSEYSKVIIPIYETQVLDRTLLYTALTRAKHQVVFVGNLEAVKKAATGPSKALSREVGFGL